MKFSEIEIGEEFVDTKFGSLWRKETSTTAVKIVGDDSGYRIGDHASFTPDELTDEEAA